MRLQIDPKPDHLYVAMLETFEHARLEQTLREIFAAAAQHQHRKILIDISAMQGEISTLARYDAGELVAKLQNEKVRLAILGTKEQLWADRFFENVANNRGVKTKVSTDLVEALKWLHE